MTTLYCLGLGVGTHNTKGEWLEIFYAQPLLNPSANTVDAITKTLNYTGGNHAINITPAQAAELADALAGAGDEIQAAVARTLSNSQRPLVVTLLE
ncbi:MAG TPA: 2,3,4,5-tetrahydropyridine-2,6-dicarboxylate N-succinyltransferase, partial [Cellvibrio sp.]|nr:2,3,4,5-tetrahydropyridine-2,6-dicarboxylate N-succinyltransferase [Cellvibrio sp.]